MKDIPELAWIIIEGKSGSTNVFNVSAADGRFAPGRSLPASHRDYAFGQEEAKIIARFEPKSCEANFLQVIDAVKLLFPNCDSPLDFDSVAALIQEIASGIREHGFAEVGTLSDC